MNVPQVLRVECKQCKKWFHPLELFLYYCHECWTKRPEAMQSFLQRQNFRQCDECNAWVIAGNLHWDCLANTWTFNCVACHEKRIAHDAQYRGTPYAFHHKTQ